jgi:DNA-binding transcriptional LysR family regulator
MKGTRVTLRQLEYFVGSAELGTFSAAAEHFHVSQTAVSLALADLERTIGVQLLVRRRPHAPVLTPAGRELLIRARRVLFEANEFESQAASAGADVVGTVVVGSFPTVTPYVMGRVLERLPERYPGLAVELVEDSVHGLQQRLRDGLCDVAIMYDIGIENGMSTTPLYRCSPHIVLAADHPLAGEQAVGIDQIIGEPMILVDLPPSVEYFFGVLGRAGYTPDVRYRAGAIETIRSLVGRGMGWSMLLHRPATEMSYDGGRVVHLPLRDIDEHVDVLLVQADAAHPTARTRAFADHCRRTLSPRGPAGSDVHSAVGSAHAGASSDGLRQAVCSSNDAAAVEQRGGIG